MRRTRAALVLATALGLTGLVGEASDGSAHPCTKLGSPTTTLHVPLDQPCHLPGTAGHDCDSFDSDVTVTVCTNTR